FAWQASLSFESLAVNASLCPECTIIDFHMKKILRSCFALLPLLAFTACHSPTTPPSASSGQKTAAAEPLRVFIRGGPKSHGPGAHEHAQFLNDWTKLLTERGMKVKGGMEFPTAEELAQTDVLLMYAQDGGNVPADRREGLNSFLKRGGGVVVIHTASVT